MSTGPVPAPRPGHCFSGGCRAKATHTAMIRVIETGRPASRAQVCRPCLESYQGRARYFEVTGVEPIGPAGGPVVRVHRSAHLCTSGCACRAWRCFECGTAELVDRRARYEGERPSPDQYGVELCDGCGAPLCDQCVHAGSHSACPGPQAAR